MSGSMRGKIIKFSILFGLVALSYTFSMTSTIHLSTTIKPSGFIPVALIPPEGLWDFYFSHEFHTEWLHWVGFAILSWAYGWIIMILAIADEVLQFFIPGRVMDIKDVARNMTASGIGLVLRYLWKKRIG